MCWIESGWRRAERRHAEQCGADKTQVDGRDRSLLVTAGCCDERLGDAACVFVDVDQLARTVSYRNLLRLHGFGDFPD